MSPYPPRKKFNILHGSRHPNNLPSATLFSTGYLNRQLNSKNFSHQKFHNIPSMSISNHMHLIQHQHPQLINRFLLQHIINQRIRLPTLAHLAERGRGGLTRSMVQIAMSQILTVRAPPWKPATSTFVFWRSMRKCRVFSVTMETKGRTTMDFFFFSIDCLIRRISATIHVSYHI